MRDINNIFGKRLKSNSSEIVARVNFPESAIKKTYPPGTVTPVIDSYIRGKWFVLKDGNRNLYVEDRPGLDIVPADAVDDFAMLPGTRFYYWFRDKVDNTGERLEKQTGFFTDAVKTETKAIFTAPGDAIGRAFGQQFKIYFRLGFALIGLTLIIKLIQLWQK